MEPGLHRPTMASMTTTAHFTGLGSGERRAAMGALAWTAAFIVWSIA